MLIEKPEMVRQLHLEYLRAGSRVITVSSYSLLPEKLQPFGLNEKVVELQRTAVKLAQEARDIFLKESDDEKISIQIAGCLPPSSSYRPDKTICDPTMLECYYTNIASMQADGVDLFLCETMGSYHEASCAIRAAKKFGKPVWCSVALDYNNIERLHSNDLLVDTLPKLEKHAPDTLLINCSSPEAIEYGISALLNCSVPTGAYLNAFEDVMQLAESESRNTTVEKLVARTDITAEDFANISFGWVDRGLKIIGGCCEISPAMINKLKEKLVENGYQIISADQL